MKTKDLIQELQKIDPIGECEVCGWDGDVSLIHRLPYYYDGRAKIFIRDFEGEIIGLREAVEEDGDKIVICSKGIADLAWDAAMNQFYNNDGLKNHIIVDTNGRLREKYEVIREGALQSYKNSIK